MRRNADFRVSGNRPVGGEPINSLRWENLREGMEDYEYLWLLQQAIERVRAVRGESDWLKQARAPLAVKRSGRRTRLT